MDLKKEDEIVAGQVSEESPDLDPYGRVIVKPFDDQVAPLEASKVQVMAELRASGSPLDRANLDLVAVLDISGSMQDEDKLNIVKDAMLFVIKKLGPDDRLSVVTFSDNAEMVCNLKLMTDGFRQTIENLVKNLQTINSTNIADGLQTGLNVISGRKYTDGRAVGIMLMSDGKENVNEAAKVKIDNVPVFTFGFGSQQDAKLLRDIAHRSRGGTFSDVRLIDDVAGAFGQCLAGLVTVAAQEVTVTLKPTNQTTIEAVSAGSYPKTTDNAGNVTIIFGDLYDKEVRNIVVDLCLPRVPKPGDMNVLKISFKFRVGKEEITPLGPFLAVSRINNPMSRETEEVTMEKKRLEIATLMKSAREKADNNDLEGAKAELRKAQDLLQRVGDQSNPVVKTMKYELAELLSSLDSPSNYQLKGLPFALSSETCHERQRYASRGQQDKVRLFATPRMGTYLEQVKEFLEDPDKPVKTDKEDAQAELAADPLASLAGPLTYYLQTAIQALQSLERALNTNRR